MIETEHTRAEWMQPLTLSDQLVIDGLADDLRAVVERYVTHCGRTPEGGDDYESGFEDGVDAMKDEMRYCDPTPPRKRRVKK